MTIIDRYLLRQFIKSLVICFVTLFGLFVVLDAFTHLDDFLRFAEKHGGLLAVMGQFYAFRALPFFDRTAGLLALTAAMFTVAWMQRHQEMTALMAAGIPRVRVVIPIVIAVAVIALTASANRELLIPRFRNELARSSKELSDDTPRRVQAKWDQRTDLYLRGDIAIADGQRIEKPDFRLPASLAHFARQVTAREAFCRPAEGKRPAGFLLDGVEQPADLATRDSLYLGELPVIITPRDAPEWLQPDQCFVVSDVTFEQLTDQTASRDFSSTAQLIAGLRGRNSDFDAGIRVTIHTRFVQPFLDMTLLFLGLPLVVSRDNRNVFLALGLCLVVVATFLGGVMACQAAGRTLLIDAALAAWLPLMIFAPAAVEMAWSMRR
jgi:lipopolysaccharide export system permease protein